MKILFIAPANSIHTVRWVNSLSKVGEEVVLVSLANHKESVDEISETVKVIYLPVKGASGYYLNAPYLKRISNKICPDVINVHYASGYGTLARIAKLTNVILSVWGSDVYQFPFQSPSKMKIIKKNLNYAKKITSTSYCMAAQIKKLISDSDIAVIPFGVDISKFKKIDIVKDYNKFTVGIIKTLLPVYGIDVVIHAFYEFYKILCKENKIQLELVIYGSGLQKEELESLCMELKIEKMVSFKGYINHNLVPEAWNGIDVACFGSREESFGVSAIEAMACEVPVIVTEADGFKEIIEDKITGYVVPLEDYKKMSFYLKSIFMNSYLVRDMRKAARKKVEELYDWNKGVNTMLELYQEMGGGNEL